MTAVCQGQSSYALLTNGSTVEIRPAGPADADAVRAMHEAMSADNIYLRFFSMSRRAAEQEAERICRQPSPDHAALLAWLNDKLVGVASYEPAGEAGTAEIAFAVPDDMHGRGIATLLLDHLVSIARQRKVRAFTAETLSENTAMLRVFADAGLPMQRQASDGVVQMTFPLPENEADRNLDKYLERVAARESRADVASLRHLLQPESVAVVGASRHRGTVGRAILHNIVDGGYAGRVYPVNPRASSMEGLHCAASVAEIPEPVDVAVIAVPPAAVPEVAAQCGQRGVHALVVITSGLGEQGADLLAICRRYGMRLVGPNCFGIGVPSLALNATFSEHHPATGEAGLVVQSGGIGISLLEHLSRLGIGISSFASVGDKFDVSSNDMLMWWEQDPGTKLAVLYVESFGNPRAFARTARRVGHRMPVLTVLGGGPGTGQRGTASYAAAAATPLITEAALFGQAGIIAVPSLGELVETAALLARQPLPTGVRVAIISNAGGGVNLAARACADNGLTVAALAGPTQRKLARLLPAGAAVAGPVDTTATVGTDAFRASLEEVAADPGVDAVIAVTVPTAVADSRQAISSAKVAKPLTAAMIEQPETVQFLDNVPAYAYPEAAARALGHAAAYQTWRGKQRGVVPELSGLRRADAQALIARFLASHQAGGWLPAADAAELLGCYRIPMATTRSAVTEDEAAAAAADIGGNGRGVVLKAEATGVMHKTDAGAVRLDLRTEDEVRGAYRQFAAAFGAGLRRVLVQPMLADGVEVLIGVVQEPVFGPLIVFGLGGMATEVLADHAARLTPLTDSDAEDLIASTRAAPLLLGHRGRAAADTAALADSLLRVSRLADDFPEIAELDLNPVIARPDGACAVDVRIRVARAEPKDPFLRRLR